MDEVKPKILAVDDSENVRKTLVRILKRENYDVNTASNGQEALENIYKWLPDIVILDVKMPVMDGIEVCRRIKTNHKFSFIYVIMLTMKTDAVNEVEGLDAGADDYIAKPFHPKVLLARVRSGLRVAKEKQNASLDALTGLHNRRVFEMFLNQEKAKSARYGRPLSLIVMDLDHFKKVNDTYGHFTGDSVLKTVAEILKNQTRASDLPARWGGEEMVVLLPETDLDGAKSVAESLRGKIESQEFPDAGRVTASFGVACMSDENSDLFGAADKAMYLAKTSGRNKVVSHDE